MKKTAKPLQLNKATISNLSSSEMNGRVGGANDKPNSVWDVCPNTKGLDCILKTIPCPIDYSKWNLCTVKQP